MLVGLILLALGLGFVLHTLEIVPGPAGATIWPLVMIATGLWLIYASVRHRHRRWRRRWDVTWE